MNNSDIVISKLRGVSIPSRVTLHAVYRSFEENGVQYCDFEALGCLSYPVVDPPCGLEIIWGPKMSKLLHLIAYSLACLLTCTNWVLSCICEHLTKHSSWIIVDHLEMISVLFIYACLGWDRSPFACGDLAQIAASLSFKSSSLLHVCYLLMVSLWGLTLVFANLGTMVEYSIWNTCLYTLWSTLI
jgi:hypothetical protein